jgi:hypothetical protein
MLIFFNIYYFSIHSSKQPYIFHPSSFVEASLLASSSLLRSARKASTSALLKGDALPTELRRTRKFLNLPDPDP